MYGRKSEQEKKVITIVCCKKINCNSVYCSLNVWHIKRRAQEREKSRKNHNELEVWFVQCYCARSIYSLIFGGLDLRHSRQLRFACVQRKKKWAYRESHWNRNGKKLVFVVRSYLHIDALVCFSDQKCMAHAEKEKQKASERERGQEKMKIDWMRWLFVGYKCKAIKIFPKALAIYVQFIHCKFSLLARAFLFSRWCCVGIFLHCKTKAMAIVCRLFCFGLPFRLDTMLFFMWKQINEQNTNIQFGKRILVLLKRERKSRVKSKKSERASKQSSKSERLRMA